MNGSPNVISVCNHGLLFFSSKKPKTNLSHWFSFVCSSKIKLFGANLPCLSILLQVSELSLPVFEMQKNFIK